MSPQNLLNNALKASGVLALVALSLFLFQLRSTAKELAKTSAETTLLVHDSRQVVADTKKQITYTSQNINAILLQVGLASDEARRASIEQRQYLKNIGAKTEDILDQAKLSLVTLTDTTQKVGGDVHQLTEASVVAINGISPVLAQTTQTLEASEKVISDPNIPKTLENINQVTLHMAGTSDSVEKSMQHIEKKVEELTKPVSFMKRLVNTLLDLGYKSRLLFGR